MASTDIDPSSYDSMQEYAKEIAESDDLVDPLINRLAKGLQAGVHESSSEEVFTQHSTVRHKEGTLHYDEESGAWRDYAD